MMDLDTIMSTDLVTIGPDDSLADARRLMRKHRIHHLPVTVDKDHLVGLVTLTDVLAASDSILREPGARLQPADVRIADVMIRNIATVSEGASLRQAALFLEKHRVGCLPVVTEGRLVGIVTDTDFVGVAINLLEQIEDSEPLDEAI